VTKWADCNIQLHNREVNEKSTFFNCFILYIKDWWTYQLKII
jgi:hypothetical protein